MRGPRWRRGLHRGYYAVGTSCVAEGTDAGPIPVDANRPDAGPPPVCNAPTTCFAPVAAPVDLGVFASTHEDSLIESFTLARRPFGVTTHADEIALLTKGSLIRLRADTLEVVGTTSIPYGGSTENLRDFVDTGRDYVLLYSPSSVNTMQRISYDGAFVGPPTLVDAYAMDAPSGNVVAVTLANDIETYDASLALTSRQPIDEGAFDLDLSPMYSPAPLAGFDSAHVFVNLRRNGGLGAPPQERIVGTADGVVQNLFLSETRTLDMGELAYPLDFEMVNGCDRVYPLWLTYTDDYQERRTRDRASRFRAWRSSTRRATSSLRRSSRFRSTALWCGRPGRWLRSPTA